MITLNPTSEMLKRQLFKAHLKIHDLKSQLNFIQEENQALKKRNQTLEASLNIIKSNNEEI